MEKANLRDIKCYRKIFRRKPYANEDSAARSHVRNDLPQHNMRRHARILFSISISSHAGHVACTGHAPLTLCLLLLLPLFRPSPW